MTKLEKLKAACDAAWEAYDAAVDARSAYKAELANQEKVKNE